MTKWIRPEVTVEGSEEAFIAVLEKAKQHLAKSDNDEMKAEMAYVKNKDKGVRKDVYICFAISKASNGTSISKYGTLEYRAQRYIRKMLGYYESFESWFAVSNSIEAGEDTNFTSSFIQRQRLAWVNEIIRTLKKHYAQGQTEVGK